MKLQIDPWGKVVREMFLSLLCLMAGTVRERFFDVKFPVWLPAHIHRLKYFGGVPETLVSADLLTGVIKDFGRGLVLNGLCRELIVILQ